MLPPWMFYTFLYPSTKWSYNTSKSSYPASGPVGVAAVGFSPFHTNQSYNIFHLSVQAQLSNSATRLLSLSSPLCRRLFLPQDACSDVSASTSRLSLFQCVCALKRFQGNSLPRAGSCCFLQLSAVWGTTAGCHGGEVARRPCCCCSRANPWGGPRPGRIRLLLQSLSHTLLGFKAHV